MARRKVRIGAKAAKAGSKAGGSATPDAQADKSLLAFISYSNKDIDKVEKISKVVDASGLRAWVADSSLKPGDNLQEVAFGAIEDADVFIVAISENSLRSLWVQSEISAAILNARLSGKSKRIIPIRLDTASVPSLVSEYWYIDASNDFEAGLERLSHALEDLSVARHPEDDAPEAAQPRDMHERGLRKALQKGRLTLVCGAGVSVAAGVPSWNALLTGLLRKVFDGLSATHSIQLDAEATRTLQNELSGFSSLIVGKYLKNNLGDNFEKEISASLYSSVKEGSELIKSIVNLARPQREGKPLDSIITFNFDDLIERSLSAASIFSKPIYSESISHEPHELPIYHVHGFLPRNESVPETTTLVFSEDAYHGQFMEPFSWSNLIQLNKLTQNTCLFIGISLTDPNMRRLLDVAWRKNPGQNMSHYIVKKRPPAQTDSSIGKIAEILEEQDANALGLNIVWINEFDELPFLIDRVARVGS